MVEASLFGRCRRLLSTWKRAMGSLSWASGLYCYLGEGPGTPFSRVEAPSRWWLASWSTTPHCD